MESLSLLLLPRTIRDWNTCLAVAEQVVQQFTELLQQVTCSEQQPTGKLLEWSDPISLD